MKTKSSLAKAIIKNQNITSTENGMKAYESSLDACVDMFFQAGGARQWSDDKIISLWEKARAEDKEISYKLLFWARDIRGGAGERRFFRVILKHIFNSAYNDEAIRLLDFVSEYGRWDDLFVLDEKYFMPLVKKGLKNSKKNALLAKWLPRRGKLAARIRNDLDLSPKQYRKKIVSLSNTVEQKMCAKEWNEIVYKTVPSVAMKKYRVAFSRNDGTRFVQYLEDVKSGKTKINASAIFPNDIVSKALSAFIKIDSTEAKAIEAQWNALPDYLAGSEEKIITVCDVSGSMAGKPLEVSVALGLYLSERLRGIFQDCIITFSEKPKLLNLSGSIMTKIKQLSRAEWGMNTNFAAVFDLILNTAIKNKIDKSEMPTKIVVISDMQFDSAGTGTFNPSAIQMIKRKYDNAGYVMPQMIFWNVRSSDNVPVLYDQRGVAMISGYSPAIIKSVLEGDIPSPREIMLKVVNGERYKQIEI